MSARRVAVLAAALVAAFALVSAGPWLAGRSRTALAALALCVAVGAPRTRSARGAPALELALCAPPLGLAAALDHAAGLAAREVLALALAALALIALAGVASDVGARSLRGLRVHAALWGGLALGAPLALGVLAWVARAPAPRALAFAAGLSPLAWLAARVPAPRAGGGAPLVLALCGALALVLAASLAARPGPGERA